MGEETKEEGQNEGKKKGANEKREEGQGEGRKQEAKGKDDSSNEGKVAIEKD